MKQYILDLNTNIYAITIDCDDKLWNDDIKILKIFESKEEYDTHTKMVEEEQQYTGQTSRVIYKK